MRSFVQSGWTRWCAVVVLALLALSMLHAATPHHPAQRDCSACKALNVPGVAQVSGGLSEPVDRPAQLSALPTAGPLSADARYLRPLRAPPETAVL